MGIEAEPNVLAKRLVPRVTVQDIKDSLELLHELELIVNEGGKWLVREPAITSGGHWRISAVRQYQRETILLGADSLETIPREERDISSLTLTLSQSDLPALRAKAEAFRSELTQMALAATESDRVMQINIQIFPMARSPKENP
jgi:uncharacterized protein (TIGR02147 family)